MSELTDIADAVVAALNDAELSQPFTAVRRYVPKVDLEVLQAIDVTVVAAGVSRTIETRGSLRKEYRVDVGVRKKVDPADTDDCDPLMTLVEEIAELFIGSALGNYTTAICTEALCPDEPPYNLDHMVELRQFTRVVQLTFRVVG